MNCRIISDPDGGLEFWAEMGHGDVLLVAYPGHKLAKLMDVLNPNGEPNYRLLADVVHCWVAADWGKDQAEAIEFQERDDVLSAILRVVEPGPPYENHEVSFRI